MKYDVQVAEVETKLYNVEIEADSQEAAEAIAKASIKNDDIDEVYEDFIDGYNYYNGGTFYEVRNKQ